MSKVERFLISVIIPSYNSGRFLNDAIKSVINQTYKNLEIIIVNDGSTDNTEEKAKALEQKDKRVKYIKHEQNRGVSAARNTGIVEAKGEYIAFLDSDDIWEKKKIEIQLGFLNGESDIVTSDAELVNEDGEKLNQIYFNKIGALPPLNPNLKDLFLKNFSLMGSSLVMKKEVIDKVGFFEENLTHSEDYDFLLRVLSEGFKMKTLKQKLLDYRIYSRQVSKNSIDLEKGRIYVLCKFLKNNPRFCLQNPIISVKRIIKRNIALIAKILGLYNEY